jgi:hypothetical protein
MINNYKFFCENCQFTKYASGNEIIGLEEVIYSEVPGGIPKINLETKKVEKGKSIERKKRFKCPKCGFLIKATKIMGENNE